MLHRGFPGGPVAKTPSVHKDQGSISGQGTRAQMLQLRLSAAKQKSKYYKKKKKKKMQHRVTHTHTHTHTHTSACFHVNGSGSLQVVPLVQIGMGVRGRCPKSIF